MKAVICQHKRLSLEDIPEPIPETGHALIEVHRCGICGSDLHARQHCDHLSQIVRNLGFKGFMQEHEAVVLGHEFCGEVLDYGPGSKRIFKPGTRICALPFIKRADGMDLLGFSKRTNGAYAERMLVDELLMVEITNGLSSDEAALTEPTAIGLHAVNKAKISKQHIAIVIGCGPVGLAVILNLKAKGVKTVIASDFSQARRQLAMTCGADILIDPSKESPYSRWEDFGLTTQLEQALNMARNGREQLGKLPIPWWQGWRVAEWLGKATPKRPVVFECVGIPGIIQQIISGAPLFSKVIVVGVCMESDYFEPTVAINKEIELHFVAGYTPLEYRDTLDNLCRGVINVKPLITGQVGLNDVQAAFDALAHPEKHAKILIDPKRIQAEL